jgi:Domain of unknown function (DUF4062)
MRKRKLQVFVSSTYEDLVPYRIAAIEAILAAGHIPAAMEQFSPGDATAWEASAAWIDESDGVVLILGGRYGSIEPRTKKSFVEREYDYAVEKKKPFVVLVQKPAALEKLIRKHGSRMVEKTYAVKLEAFKRRVSERLCGSWSDEKDIRNAILTKLPQWTIREDVIGWVRGDEATSAQVAAELARLSDENRALRARIAEPLFDGLTFVELVRRLQSIALPRPFAHQHGESVLDEVPDHAWRLFELTVDKLGIAAVRAARGSVLAEALAHLLAFDLVSADTDDQVFSRYRLTETGRRCRTQLWRRQLESNAPPDPAAAGDAT